MYIYQRSDWPRFQWNQQDLLTPLAAVRHKQGLLVGRMASLGFPLRAEAMLRTLTLDVVKSLVAAGAMAGTAIAMAF